jgi:peptide/nickel transport system substrate-binding protein
MAPGRAVRIWYGTGPKATDVTGGVGVSDARGTLSRRQLLRRAGGALLGGGAVGVYGRPLMQAFAAGGAGGPVRGGALKVATIGDPPTVDIHQTTAVIAEQVTQEVYETLFALDGNWTPQPLLAAGYSWSKDDLTLTIPLRGDVVFHDGSRMGADDVVASLNRWMRLSALGQTIRPKVKAVAARGSGTVLIGLTEPVGSLVASLANPNNMPAIMPKSLIDKFGDKPITTPVGTGPYKFVEWRPDAYIKVARFDGYKPVATRPSGYAGRRVAYLDEIDFLPVPESNTRVAGMQSGQYDFALQLPEDQYAQIKANPSLVPEIVKPYAWATFVFNKKKGVFTNQKARQGFLRALDLKPIMQAAFGPQEFWSIASPTIAYGAWTDNATGAGVFNHQDPAAAKSLVRESGYDGKPILFMVTKDYDFMYNSALVAKDQLAAAGFNINLQVVDWATLVQRRNNPDLYDVFTTGFVFSPADPTAQDVFVSDKWPGWWVSDKKDAALRRFTQTVDLAKRKAAWREIQALFYEEAPVVKLGDYFLLNVAQSRVKGFQNTPNLFFWNVWLARG